MSAHRQVSAFVSGCGDEALWPVRRNGTPGSSGSRDAWSWVSVLKDDQVELVEAFGIRQHVDGEDLPPVTVKPDTPAAAQTGQMPASEDSQRFQLTRLTAC